jgi:hypothetical protein
MDVERLFAEPVTFDLNTITLGEAAAAEIASGKPLSSLLKSPTARRMLAVFVTEYRNSGVGPSWSELSNLRLLDAMRSTSQSSPDGVSETSKA